MGRFLKSKKTGPAKRQGLFSAIDSLLRFPAGSPRITALVLALFAFLLYANTLDHGYALDDDLVISKNSQAQGGMASIPEILSTDWCYGSEFHKENNLNSGLYRPLPMITHALAWEWMPNHPAFYHLLQVLLYALLVAILFLWMHAWFGATTAPLFIALLFAAHPVHTEVVANLKSRDEILCLLFMATGFLALHRYIKHGSRLAFAGSLTAFFLAMLSKETGLSAAGLVPLYAYMVGGPGRRKTVLSFLALAGVAATYLFLRKAILGDLALAEIALINNSITASDGLWSRWLTCSVIMIHYLKLSVIPWPLSYDYSYNQIPVYTPADASGWFALAAVSVLFFYGALIAFRRRWPGFALCWFFMTIFLASNYLFFIEATMAERFLFTPSLGMALLGGCSLAWLAGPLVTDRNVRSGRPLLATGLVLGIVLGFTVLTIARNPDWKNNSTLFGADVKKVPRSARAQYNYGWTLIHQDAMAEPDSLRRSRIRRKGLEALQRAVNIYPQYSGAWKLLGQDYEARKQYQEALNAYSLSNRYAKVKSAELYAREGWLRSLAGDSSAAMDAYRAALAVDPVHKESLLNLGTLLFDHGRMNEAIALFDRLLAVNPGHARAWQNKGSALASMGRYDEGIAAFRQALLTDSINADIYGFIGLAYRKRGDERQARFYFMKACDIKPEYCDPRASRKSTP